jgi:O-antigen/teichoic acid export membrane protein
VKYVLWIAQVLLALAFVSAGAMTLITPEETLTAWYPFSALFIRVIGVCELLSAVGLILPGLLRVREEFTPLAAAGLASIMTGAVATTLAVGGGTAAAMPLALGLVAVFVAYGWTRPARRSSEEARQSVLFPAAS